MTNMEPNKPASQVLPPTGEHVVARCAEFSCLAYFDVDRVWKSAFTDKPLPEVIDYSPIG